MKPCMLRKVDGKRIDVYVCIQRVPFMCVGVDHVSRNGNVGEMQDDDDVYVCMYVCMYAN
jgi:hypothetical protein